MSTDPNIHARESLFFRNGGEVWGKLRAEREDVCKQLLAESQPFNDLATGWQEVDSPSEDTARDVEWKHRELLQARLRQLDDALDRLMAGSYGRCSECGKVIDDQRLRADGAVPFCLRCQRTAEGEHLFQTL